MPCARGTGLTILAGRPNGPGQLSQNLELWLRSDAGIGLVTGAVASWADQSGHSPARDALQATSGNRPGYTLVDANFNNKPSLNFNGVTNNRFLAGSFPITQPLGSQSFTIMCVSKQAVASQSGGIVDITNSGGHTNVGYLVLQNGTNRDYRYGSAADTQYAFASTSAAVNFARATRTGVNIETKDLFEKDVIKATNGVTIGPFTLTQYRVGRLFDDVFPWNGDIAEIAVWTKALSLAEIVGLSGYVSAKYGIA